MAKASTPKPPKPFKVAVIGMGGIASQHIKNLKLVPGVEIMAVADVRESSLEYARTTLGIPRTFSDYKKMLRELPELDGVSVCTPNGLHAENTIAALEAGCHVIVEKPMAMNAAEGQAMVNAAKKARKHLVVGFQFRFDPKTRMIRSLIEKGEFGKILYVRCQALRRRGIPNWGVFGRKDLQGGGPMIDIGVHVLEMAHFMMGSPRPVTATGNTWTFMGDKPSQVKSGWPNWDYKTYTVEDMATGMIRFETGAMLTIESSFVAHIEKDQWNVQIMGEKGGAVWDPLQISTDQNGYMVNLTPAFVGNWDVFLHKMTHWVEVCRDGRANESSGEQGLMVQKILDGVYASADAGHEVRIK